MRSHTARIWFIVQTLVFATLASAHDIPNARVDRSTQVVLAPGKLTVHYEVSLSELTLTQDLRGLIGTLPGSDRLAWFNRYGAEVGPLNARGFVIHINDEPVELAFQTFDVVVEEHPRFTFHADASIPSQGKLRVFDSNYAASEGTSRLALRAEEGVVASGDSLPSDVQQVLIVPAWELTPAQERRTKSVTVEYRTQPVSPIRVAKEEAVASQPSQPKPDGLTRLLDEAPGQALPVVCLLALVLGAAHSLQPGHGKTLIVAGAIGHAGGRWRGALLGLAAATGHMISVSVLAGLLWLTRDTHYERWNSVILKATGFWIAAMGLWRLGYHLGDFGQQPSQPHSNPAHSHRGIFSLGFASGLIPCWDAVALLLIAAAVGRLGLGLILLACFSLGMAAVLVSVGMLATRFSKHARNSQAWSWRLGVTSGCLLAIIGALLLIR